MPRPALGKVAVGDRLLVIRPYNRYRDNDPIPVHVTKVGRVWVNLAADGNRAYRMRLDTQNEGSEYSQQHRFVTPEQYAWERELSAARATLGLVKIHTDHDSPWRYDDRLLALADFIRTYDEEHQ